MMMQPIPESSTRKAAFGCVRVITTVESSGASMDDIEASEPAVGDAVTGSTNRSKLYFTSEATTARPLWKVAGCKWKV